MKGLTKIIAIVGLGVITFILLVVLVVSPLLSEVTTTNSKVREKNVELAVLKQQIRAFKNAQADLDKASRKEDLLKAIPTKEDLVLSVLDMEKAATATNTETILQLAEIATPNSKDKKNTAVINKKVGIEEVQYELKARNDFAGTVNFMSYLEHLPHFTEISKIIMTSELAQASATTSGRTGIINTSFSGVFFIRPQK
jgi:hypothetical protein